ncbi:MAG: 50S ribosomal protein L18e [Thaumarchaeota archaeon]|nr:50S ribosomal protein L18e [Candidatus Calditenuaceae archaeon]MDW8187176.1 50S ribosomal protein L18e [Nitrososphaerota archaeon]
MGKLHKPRPTKYDGLVSAVSRLADSSEHRERFWERVLEELKRSKRSRRVVNLYELNRTTSPHDRVIVLGKLLGIGRLDHPLTVVAFDFSETAYEKVKRAGGTAIYLDQFVTEGAREVSGYRLMG